MITTPTRQLQDELRLAQEGLEQIHKAWQDGDYDHQYFKYERDRQSTEQAIDRLTRKIEAQEVPADYDSHEDYEQDQKAAAETIANGDY